MNAGRLDRLATILANTQGRSESGSVVDSWEPMATLWCNALDTGGDASTNAGRDDSEQTTVFEMRYLASVKPNQRISVRNTTYDILRVDEIGRRDGMRVTAKVRTA